MNIDIVYDPDVTKKKILVFNQPDIIINNTNVDVNSNGYVYTLSEGTVVDQMIFSTKVINPFSGKETTLDDDQYNYKIVYSIQPSVVELPAGLNIVSNSTSDESNNLNIYGVVSSLNDETYEFLVRATLECYDKNGSLVRKDNTDYYCYFDVKKDLLYMAWDTIWLNGLISTYSETYKQIIYSFGILSRGENFSESLILNNQKSNVNFELIDIDDISDNGVHVNSQGILTGNISISSKPKTYLFRIKVTDLDDNNTGTPPTENTIFSITIIESVIVDNSHDDILSWITTDSYLGSQYENYSAIFSVQAIDSENKEISYSISPKSAGVMPSTLTMDSKTGYIIGSCPYVNNVTYYYITIRASVGSYYIEKQFYFKIYPKFYSDRIVNLEIPVTEEIRRRITSNSWDTNVIKPDYVYRMGDPNYGRPKNQNIYFINGLKEDNNSFGYWDHTLDVSNPNYGTILSQIPDINKSNFSSCFEDKLSNYHHPFDVIINDIRSSPIYSIDGVYICDVVYYHLTDNLEKVGGFDQYNKEQLLVDDSKNNNDIPEWNMDNTDIRIFPTGFRNCRLDLILTTNRINSPTYTKNPSGTFGIGFRNSEGYPLWMVDKNGSFSYIPGIVVVYVKPRYGSIVVNNIKNSSYYNLIGETFTIDRYIMKRTSKSEMHFDLDGSIETTFDCDEKDGIIDIETGTWFDVSLTEYDTIYKFPPGDIG